jgi:toxin ParE1/3/4
MKVVWRHRAELQLRAQLAYLKRVNLHAARRMAARIKQRVGRLKQFPRSGRPSGEPGVRELVISGTPYVAVYLIDDGAITILRFFHMSQDR